MKNYYWELNPKELFEKNPKKEKILTNNNGNYPKNVVDLFDSYNEHAMHCLRLQQTIRKF
ncbi:hypothetical protein P0E58_14695 [Enterococcus faecalis]|uniref:hypothetical protein n=1 Tax=Enterococcus faecalis TaxID=1351 RepID=UPI0019271484|nr:hypothetical protein [Enterococcus faecalis]MDN3139732.1 hypothetical protein [Enterococcus faecalis]